MCLGVAITEQLIEPGPRRNGHLVSAGNSGCIFRSWEWLKAPAIHAAMRIEEKAGALLAGIVHGNGNFIGALVAGLAQIIVADFARSSCVKVDIVDLIRLNIHVAKAGIGGGWCPD